MTTYAHLARRKSPSVRPSVSVHFVCFVPPATPTTMTKPQTPSIEDKDSDKSRKRGWDEIESLFMDKKQKKQSEMAAEEGKAKRSTHKKTIKHSQKPNGKSKDGQDWVDDGLGGKFNPEGFTGRVEDGVKIFKAHVLYKDKSGQTNDCPFDCKCCFI
jgi:hypothetical protein